MIRISLSGAEKSLDTILLRHQRVTSALRARLRDERTFPMPEPIFLSMTDSDVDEFFADLEFMSILDLMSATEAALRVDFWCRVRDRKKDPLSRKFRAFALSEGRKISLRLHILDSWLSNDPELASRVSDFRGTLKLRDWLAHGRYWTPKFGRTDYSPVDVFDVCDRLLRKMSIR